MARPHICQSWMVFLIGILVLIGDTEARQRPSTLDSTDRRTYEYAGPRVRFGQHTGVAVLPVPEYFNINDVDVTVYIDHTWIGDLQLYLVAPDGEEVQLYEGRGGQGIDMHDTEYNDDARTPIRDGSPPYTGSFRPQEPLSVLHDGEGMGDWTLRMEDTFPSADDGLLHWWRLTLGGVVGGVIRGMVSSLGTGQSLEGVRIESMTTGFATLSDAHGYFQLYVVEGTHDIHASFPDYCTETVAGVTVSTDDTLDMDFELRKPEFVSLSSSVNVLAVQGGEKSVGLPIFNPGNCDLEWEATAGAGWVSLDADRGVVPGEDTAGCVVTVRTNDLGVGDHVTWVTYTHNAEGSPDRIPIFLTVFEDLDALLRATGIPDRIELVGCYPNPFNPVTNIVLELAAPTTVTLTAFDQTGREAVRLIDHQSFHAGSHVIPFDGSDLASGVYYCRLESADYHRTRKMVLVK